MEVIRTVFIDGGSRGNPGESATGYIVLDDYGNEVFRKGRRIGVHTNNYSEYSSLIEALIYIKQNHKENAHKEIVINSDSELLVNQINNHYKVKSKNLLPLFHKAQKLLEVLPNVRIQYIRREQNRTADWIVNRILDNKPYRPVDRSQVGRSYGTAPEESPGS